MWALWAVGMRFQFTPLREGRLIYQSFFKVLPQFQFTPLREGRLLSAIQGKDVMQISIHAPA